MSPCYPTACRDRVPFGLYQFGGRLHAGISGRVCHGLTPLVPAWGVSIVACECGGREMAVIEKRQNEANSPVVLVIGIL